MTAPGWLHNIGIRLRICWRGFTGGLGRWTGRLMVAFAEGLTPLPTPSWFIVFLVVAGLAALLLIMQKRGMLKYHKVVQPGGKWSFSRWPHWASRIKDRSGQIWSVDSFFVPHGTDAQVVRWENWYL